MQQTLAAALTIADPELPITVPRLVKRSFIGRINPLPFRFPGYPRP
jgi:hypothetical protein